MATASQLVPNGKQHCFTHDKTISSSPGCSTYHTMARTTDTMIHDEISRSKAESTYEVHTGVVHYMMAILQYFISAPLMGDTVLMGPIYSTYSPIIHGDHIQMLSLFRVHPPNLPTFVVSKNNSFFPQISPHSDLGIFLRTNPQSPRYSDIALNASFVSTKFAFS